MIKYYKLFDLMNRKEMKKTDLLKIISSPTLAKLSKGETIKTDIIDKICEYLKCQPGDIMEYIETSIIDNEYIEEITPQLNGKNHVQYYPKKEEPDRSYKLGIEYYNSKEDK